MQVGQVSSVLSGVGAQFAAEASPANQAAVKKRDLQAPVPPIRALESVGASVNALATPPLVYSRPLAAVVSSGVSSGGINPRAAQGGRESDIRERLENADKRADTAEIAALVARDREVRLHERAHASVGGAYAGAPSYTYERGPDGISYAVGGEVSIDTSPIAGDPEATIAKMQTVKAAALAPAEPSGQDRLVAAIASRQLMEARVEMQKAEQEQANPVSESNAGKRRGLGLYESLSTQMEDSSSTAPSGFEAKA